MIPSLEDLRREQLEQRRRLLALLAASAIGASAGWLINAGFTALNAARIAGGW